MFHGDRWAFCAVRVRPGLFVLEKRRAACYSEVSPICHRKPLNKLSLLFAFNDMIFISNVTVLFHPLPGPRKGVADLVDSENQKPLE